jgi:hypothetical protein
MYPNGLAVKARSASTLAQVNNRGSNHPPAHRQRLLRPMNPNPSARDGGFGRHGVRIAGVCCHQGVREIRLPHFTQGNG